MVVTLDLSGAAVTLRAASATSRSSENEGKLLLSAVNLLKVQTDTLVRNAAGDTRTPEVDRMVLPLFYGIQAAFSESEGDDPRCMRRLKPIRRAGMLRLVRTQGGSIPCAKRHRSPSLDH
jgi:hypothetical protein